MVVIDRKFVKEQVQRLAGLDYYPHKDEPALRALGDALESSNSEAVAMWAVSQWLATQRACPKPADLYDAIREEREKRAREGRQSWRRDYSCSRCHDTGLYGGEMEGPYAGPWKWCDCPAGVARRVSEAASIEAGIYRGVLGNLSSLDSVAEGNAAREKLIRRFTSSKVAAVSMKRTNQMLAVGDVWEEGRE